MYTELQYGYNPGHTDCWEAKILILNSLMKTSLSSVLLGSGYSIKML